MASLPKEERDPEQEAQTERLHARALSMIPEFNRRAAIVYADVYTLEELQAAITFYSTPAGKALLTRGPAVQAEAQRQLTPTMQTIVSELTAPD